MGKAYGTTSVPVERSQSAIRDLVMTRGGSGIAFIEQPPMEGFHCLMPIEGVTYTVRIQAQIPTQIPKEVRDQNQERRRIWRVLYFHIKSVFESSASGVLEFREMMLPYIVTANNQTVAERILPTLEKAIQTNPARLLSPTRDHE
jgi:hypothetical protein